MEMKDEVEIEAAADAEFGDSDGPVDHDWRRWRARRAGAGQQNARGPRGE
ncbi:conserved hypothetical protein [Ricinus communis]|uniref:Uncharacterized protein n=1 Tax=Ricinus communis TaxID=3988 RepID=B9TLE4_RICCO|nr:conserved hypothetical protein [Ricinus communis]